MNNNQTAATVSAASCTIAATPEAFEAVYRLRYRCYRRKLSIAEREDERFCDDYDLLPNSFSFLVQGTGEEPLATVRISVVRPDCGWTRSPVEHVYGDHPVYQEIAAESYVEASRLCFAPQARRDSFVRLLGHMAALAEFYEAGWLVACPRQEHSPVYQRMFGFRPLAEPRQYFGVSFKTQLLAVRVEDLRRHVSRERPMVQAWNAARAWMGQSSSLPALRA